MFVLCLGSVAKAVLLTTLSSSVNTSLVPFWASCSSNGDRKSISYPDNRASALSENCNKLAQRQINHPRHAKQYATQISGTNPVLTVSLAVYFCTELE